MAADDRVFVIVVENQGGRDPDRMPLLNREADGRRLSPAFTTMQRATQFLSAAQELGYHVELDYIFPAAKQRLGEDFPGHEFHFDPSPEAFFTRSPS